MNDTPETPSPDTAINFVEERLKLERERLEVERERLEARSARLAAQDKLSAASRNPWLLPTAVALLAALCFSGGLLAGVALMESRQQRQREQRLAKALSSLDSLSSTTNSIPALQNSTPQSAHRNVSVLVIQ